MRQPDGTVKMALIQVTRRSGITWEVAKGKLEEGESPEVAAVREVQEEMGINADLKIMDRLGVVRFGFLAPGGLPRLKSVFLYLMETPSDVNAFKPADKEGVKDVRWFTPDEAFKAVTHSSLLPLMRHARNLLSPEGDG